MRWAIPHYSKYHVLASSRREKPNTKFALGSSCILARGASIQPRTAWVAVRATAGIRKRNKKSRFCLNLPTVKGLEAKLKPYVRTYLGWGEPGSELILKESNILRKGSERESLKANRLDLLLLIWISYLNRFITQLQAIQYYLVL